ncbi:hypothetical protein [Ructibacterium gallinarum]|uniref:Uncharacterized protein n=1 Tax=Ructibacterium gallinarum TaxID=2779355 RepID=A0A9D5LZT1_9FIRM|nr:hypothetical protein [Ructibacterium gallinarum]MBE5041088.1 hypothetical protein [Ructibacterium gallinarum]
MSLWYDKKGKEYATKGPTSWIKYYAEYLVSNLRDQMDARLTRHYDGTEGRHRAEDIDFDESATVKEMLETETSQRKAEDALIRGSLQTESQTRASEDARLAAQIASGEELTQAALDKKVDKIEGKGLSANDYTDAEKSKLSGIEAGAQVNSVTSVAGRIGAVTLSKGDVGLSNVDNTADLAKPISTATQAALNQKADTAYVDSTAAGLAQKSEVLTKTNTEAFAPTGAYQPATKKYVDDSVSAAGGGDMLKSVYDQDGDDVVDNAKALEGHNASYFAAASALDGYAQKNHSAQTTDYGIGNTAYYGHVKLCATLTQASYTPGYALAASLGKVLSDRIAVLENAKPQPPALTAVTPDGTQIGTAGWTGTGFFCTASGTKYTAGSEISAAISGFQRFCLRFADADSRAWTFWTPYLDVNGKAYPFFYSETRGLYDGLIPATTQTAEQVVSAIRWENTTPVTIRYGLLSNAVIYESEKDTQTGETTKTYVLMRDTASLINNGGAYSEKDTGILEGIYKANIDFSAIENTAILCKLMLTADTTGEGNITMISVTRMMQKMLNGSPLPIETIDNFTA